MKNANLLIGGATGSGKSTLTRALIDVSARVICLDVMGEYEGDDYYVAMSYADAAQFYLANRWQPFKLSLQMGVEAQYALLELAFHTQRVEPHGPLVVVMEEAIEHSTTWDIQGIVHELYTRGRHARISSITVVQQDTDINRITKHSASAIVAFRQNYLSGAWERYFKWEDVQTLVSLTEEYTERPAQGRNFLVFPPVIEDVYLWWWERHGWIADKPVQVALAQ